MSVLYSKEEKGTKQHWSNYNGNWSQEARKSYIQVGGNGVVKRPNWRRLPPMQKANPLPYSKYWSYSDHGACSYSHTQRSPSQYLFANETGPIGSLFPEAEIDVRVLDEAKYVALNKLFSLMKGEGSNLANVLGERKQVARSVESALLTIAYTARDLRHGRITSAIRRMGGDPKTARKLRSQDIANQWLSLQYGWLPLVSDVYGIVMNLHKREKNLPKVFRKSHKVGPVVGASNTSSYSKAWQGKYKNYGVRVNAAVAKYMIRAYPNIVLAEPAALGFTDPLTVLWEVTPWSFVVDWFLPVGTYLEQLTADHGWYFHDGCFSGLQEAWGAGEWQLGDAYSSAGWDYTTYDSGRGSTYYAKFNRTMLGSFPTPRIPHFKNPFSISHLQNALALAYQCFGRHR